MENNTIDQSLNENWHAVRRNRLVQYFMILCAEVAITIT